MAVEGEGELAAIERSRLKAFVEGDWDTVDLLHADDFQLINPFGVPHSKEDYLGPMRRGEFRYLHWDPDGPILESRNGDCGAVRYRARLSVRLGDHVLPEASYYHTDYYEKRDGRWQVVFSQATEVRPMQV
ncbi:MAG TPA: nuclear transport factor 2 family protein [Sphingomonadaceae bacterium]|nr:nuclear transport factor 2 family protein [Sphingomonadaceae bacterium]